MDDAVTRSREAARLHENSNILINECHDRGALQAAATAAIAGAQQLPLAGFTFVAKDMIEVAGLPTTRGSALYGSQTALATAPCVTSLEEAGATLVGKANLHEFAYGVTSENPHWGDVGNPTHPHLIAGGSSGGSAAAIAAGISTIALGTDTAGSIRMPAACCGVVGLRPRVGVLSTVGVAPLAPAFDVVGPMAASVQDCAAAWTALSGRDVDGLETLAGLVVGVIEECPQADEFERLGAELRPVSLPADLLTPFWTIFRAQVTRTHEATFPESAARYSPNVRAKLENAGGIDVLAFDAATRELARLRSDFLTSVEGCHVLISATLGRAAPEVGCDETAIRDDLGRLTAAFSALDLAALAVGNLQIIARTEEEALAAGLCWETRVGTIPVPW